MTSLIDRLSYEDVARTIDHSLLRPELDDQFIADGCRLAAQYKVASVCVRPALSLVSRNNLRKRR